MTHLKRWGSPLIPFCESICWKAIKLLVWVGGRSGEGFGEKWPLSMPWRKITSVPLRSSHLPNCPLLISRLIMFVKEEEIVLSCREDKTGRDNYFKKDNLIISNMLSISSKSNFFKTANSVLLNYEIWKRASFGPLCFVALYVKP